jgi:DNA mismatch repair protein MutL
MGKIVRLDSVLINQIAAGEVIERPASLLKEIIENSIDANATLLKVFIEEGGKTFLSVQDDGCGMDPVDALLSIERHATSKLSASTLFAISTMGFRGEALASIASVSRLHIQTNTGHEPTGFSIKIDGGQVISQGPYICSKGTTITIEDLFFSTPPRLHFLKSSQIEQTYCLEWIDRFACIHHHIGFEVIQKKSGRTLRDYPKKQDLYHRLKDVLNEVEIENLRPIEAHLEDISLSGWISLPTLNRAKNTDCYTFVNQRFVKDKLIHQAIKIAYRDTLSHDRYPVVILHLSVPFRDVDVNVHPAKQDIRFKDGAKIRNFIISSIQKVLNQTSQRSSTHITSTFIHHQKTAGPYIHRPDIPAGPQSAHQFTQEPMTRFIQKPVVIDSTQSINVTKSNVTQSPAVSPKGEQQTFFDTPSSLGQAKAQVLKSYIICENNDSLIIIDQHAAHERIVYEKLKQDISQKNMKKQMLATPVIIHLNQAQLERFLLLQYVFIDIGFDYDIYGCSVSILSVPDFLPYINTAIIIDLLDQNLDDISTIQSDIDDYILKKLSRIACHHSIRFGKDLTMLEMQMLLKDMDHTIHSGQCNHGRPTHIVFRKKDLENLFERTG